MKLSNVILITLYFGMAPLRSAQAADNQSALTSIDAVYASAPRESDVAVVGVIAQYQDSTSAGGKAYEVFQLCQNRCITVFLPARMRINDGDPVRVTGRFKPRTVAGDHIFYNEIVADSVQPYVATIER